MLDNKRKGAEDYYRQIMSSRKNGDMAKADSLELEFRRVAETGGFYENENYQNYLRGLAEDKKMIIEKENQRNLMEKMAIVNSSEFREIGAKIKKLDDGRKTTAFYAEKLKSQGIKPILTYSQKAVSDNGDLDGMAEYLHGNLSAELRSMVAEGFTEGLQGVGDKAYIASREYSIGMSKSEMVAFGATLASTYGKKARHIIDKLNALSAEEAETRDLLKLNNFG
ncbi:MAG: hypothetical protein AAB116_18285 [Candidatus Poribacteria bacterium]